MLPFALNHMTAPRLGWQGFLRLAKDLGCIGVEFRNDLPGALFGGSNAGEVGAAIKASGLRFLALAEVKMFNDWSEAKRTEAASLMQIAVAAGAEAISLIPRNDGIATSRSESAAVTEVALRELLPMLKEHGLKAMVEPLGFEVCSLRYKDVLADVIDKIGGRGTYFMVHDTFHHALAGGGPIFADMTGIVHVSGVNDPIYLNQMRDGHRVLVGPDDLLGNVAQIRALQAAGYSGPISYEPFAASVHDLADVQTALAASMQFIRAGVDAGPKEYRPERAVRWEEGVPDTESGGETMKKTLILAGFAALMGTSAMADGIGVSMARFDDNFLTVLRNGMDAKGKELGVALQIEDAQDDVAKQLDQINNFIASGVSAIIVNPVDTSATQAMSDAAAAANIPLVYVNRQPINVDTLPDNQAFVASNEVDSGTLETIEVCNQLKAMGKDKASVYVMMGQLSNQAAVQRTADIHDVMAAGKCAVELTIIDEQTANWSRDEAQNLMTNWLSTGTPFDGVIANNDEMALGAIQAIKAGGIDMASVVIGGIDATQDALLALQAGDQDVTVFQDAAGQGAGALDAAIKLAAGEAVDQKVYIPFQLVTAANVADFLNKN